MRPTAVVAGEDEGGYHERTRPGVLDRFGSSVQRVFGTVAVAGEGRGDRTRLSLIGMRAGEPPEV